MTRERTASLARILAGLAIFAATAGVLLARVYRGVDFTDESFPPRSPIASLSATCRFATSSRCINRRRC
jgi:hypothetical protein